MVPVLAWNIGGMEIALVAGIALLLFGTRLPAVARSMGRGITEFKRGLKDPPAEDDDGDLPATRKDEDASESKKKDT
jgi:sec-independent protein translocase protein TatA